MTTVMAAPDRADAREPSSRHYLMCPPTYFDVRYAINPWMDPTVPVDLTRALAQWWSLVEAYRAYGHRVELLEPVPGLPDLVFAANGATVVDGRVFPARLASPYRSAEAAVHTDWHRRRGTRGMPDPVAVNEGEGDFAVLGDVILAGYGFRTEPDAHAELATLTGREVVGLELVDPRFYHLDTALAVLDDRRGHLAYYPEAFSPASRRELARRFPDAVLATAADAYAFGLNAVSDGLRVFLPAAAGRLADRLAASGYHPVPVDLSELAKSGGSVKCCTQEIRGAP